MDVPLASDLEEELDGARTVVRVDERDFAAVDSNSLIEGKGDDEERGDFEGFDKEAGGDVGAENHPLRPCGAETGVVIGVEVGEEVGDGEIAGGSEGVDDEEGFGDEIGLGEIGGDWRERRVVGEEIEGEGGSVLGREV